MNRCISKAFCTVLAERLTLSVYISHVILGVLKNVNKSRKAYLSNEDRSLFYLFIYSHIKPYIYTWLHFHINAECNEAFSKKA